MHLGLYLQSTFTPDSITANLLFIIILSAIVYVKHKHDN